MQSGLTRRTARLHLENRALRGLREASHEGVSLSHGSGPSQHCRESGTSRNQCSPEMGRRRAPRTARLRRRARLEREACHPWSWHPARQVLRAIRDYQRAKASAGIARAPQAKLAVLRHRFWSAVAGTDVPLNSIIAGGLVTAAPQRRRAASRSRASGPTACFSSRSPSARAPNRAYPSWEDTWMSGRARRFWAAFASATMP